MRHRIGTICMVLGAALVMGALSLFIYNYHEAARAQQASNEQLEQLLERIDEEQNIETDRTADSGEMAGKDGLYPTEMATVEIDGYMYIGYISIPVLGIELPVMADWSYDRLQISACRYSGTVGTNDMVIMAHNYYGHFGGMSGISVGDTVFFEDVRGNRISYEVAAVDILAPTAVEDMIAGEYDLTLFTCTYGGGSRMTVRCERSGK